MNIWSAWIVAIWRLIFVGPEPAAATAPDAEPEMYCTGAYVQHWFKRGPVCLRCGKPNARHRLPPLRDLLAEAREDDLMLRRLS